MGNEIKVGDRVTFESSATGEKNTPRWNMNQDTGGSGQIARGLIHQVDETFIYVSFVLDGYIGTGMSKWPNHTHPKYSPEQWNKQGYLKTIRCDCGSEKLYKDASSQIHSHWCSKYYKGEWMNYIIKV